MEIIHRYVGNWEDRLALLPKTIYLGHTFHAGMGGLHHLVDHSVHACEFRNKELSTMVPGPIKA